MDPQARVSGFNAPGGWSWPEDMQEGARKRRKSDSSAEAASSSFEFVNTPQTESTSQQEQPTPEEGPSSEEQPRQRHYKPRTCRICLESVLPTYEPPNPNLPSYLQGQPNVVYESEDDGRLIRPCKCKGSQRYVHEGCLQAWRHENPGNARNYWECPTCGFKYKLERMRWGRWISSKASQLALTIAIFFVALFILGFLADPILKLYSDPVGWIATDLLGEEDDYPPIRRGRYESRNFREVEEKGGWAEHFLKGLASMGVLGFVKMIWGLSPFQWLNVRGGFFGGGGVRVGSTGRDRAANVSWLVLIIGVCTFLYTVWRIVSELSRRFLKSAGERVMDVPLGSNEAENDDDDDD